MATIICKYDELVHLVCENKHKRAYVNKQVKKLFPLYSNDKAKYIYHEFAGPTNIEMYAYYRSLGMSTKDAANSIGLSHRIIEKMLNGEGIPLDVLVDFAKAEIFTKAECKATHLKDLEIDNGKGAALTFLQTVYPKEFHKDALVHNLTVNNNVTTDPEQLMKERGIPIPDNELDDINLGDDTGG